MKKICVFCSGIILLAMSANAASVVATVNGNPITDTDVTARTELMARQGKTSTTNRRTAFQNIVDDYVKLKYASNYGVNPTDKDADKELERMNLGNLSETMKSMFNISLEMGPTSAPLLRTKHVIRVGGFDEAIQARQDWDLWIRICKYYKAEVVYEALWIYHLHHQKPNRLAGKIN